MDQYHTAKTNSQMTPEGDSRDHTSATSSSVDTTMAPGTSYFNFFGLPRELRDMIYDQFQRLHPDTPAFCEDGRPEPMESGPVKTKPITDLLLVNKMTGSEYRDTCEKRAGVTVSTYMEQLVPGASWAEQIPSRDTEKASFMHVHAGDWMDYLWDDGRNRTLSPLKDWLAHWDSQMPQMDSITVSIYVHIGRIESDVERRKLEEALEDFASAPKLRELKMITMNDGMDWQRPERDTNSKRLLVHWTPGGARKPLLIDSPSPYVETCCELLGPFRSIPDGISSDSDDDGNDGNDGDDGNGNNDSDKDYRDFESDDENIDAGNSSNEDMDDGDEEDAESESQDANEDSDELGSSCADTTSSSETNQAPGYFDFFGLPPEIRDMIYDQPETLDQEIPLYHFGGLYHSSLAMGATKPRTPLLLVNHQFSSEYQQRCEGRSGLVISDKMINFRYSGWDDEVGIPPAVAPNASFMHIHIGMFMDSMWYCTDLGTFETWLAHWMPQMPKLQTITVNLYTDPEYVEEPESREGLIRELGSLLAVAELTELKVLVMEDAELWQSKDEAKHLLVHWKRARAVPPQLMYPPLDYEEECCHESFAGKVEVCDRLSSF